MIGEILIEFLITVAEMIIDGKGNRIATLLVCLFCGSLLILTLISMVTSWEADPEQAWRMGIVSLILGVAICLCMYSVLQKRRKE